ncbi:MAG: hypothetical protein EU529_12695 [Promethearchaeota archaeon]|nr:MAG: hypothetical protein EU529_12695 [Candidatus Lokiarchaeota archaeon]
MTEINLKKRRNRKLIFFNDAIEYFDKFDEFHTQETFINQEANQLNIDNPNQLRDQMLNELNNLKDLIANNPDLKFKALSKKQKNFFYDFINFYSVCPVCGNCNHYSHLKRFYFDESTTSIKHKLIRLMKLKSKLLKNFNVNFGIPCCNCFKKNFT